MGISSIKPITVLLVAGVVLAGCQSSRMGALETQSQPAPLMPAPAGTVTSNQLPPPVQPNAQQNGNFPTAPANASNPNGTDVASVENPSSIQNVSTNAPVTKEALVGAWKVSTGGSNCQMFMALTKWTGGFRAASRGCPGDAAAVSAWNVSGNKVVLSDTDGNQVATLFQSGATRYDGQTSGGSAISLSR